MFVSFVFQTILFGKVGGLSVKLVGKPLLFFYNIPVLSFLLLRGKAACCQAKISFQYPAVELLTALLFTIGYLKFPFLSLGSQAESSLHLNNLLRFCHFSFFSSVLIICSFIDLKYMIIPDFLSLGLVALSPIVVFLHPELDLKSSLIGVVSGFAVIYIIAWSYYFLRRKEGIGFGDAKLLGAIGGWLGYQSVLPTLFLGSILGSVVGIIFLLISKRFSMQAEIPFGPFLALGAIVYLFTPSVFFI